MTENRRANRVHTRLRCWCEGDYVTVYARIGNLSEGGLFLRTRTPLPQGAEARIRFGLGPGPGSEIDASARVVWARDPGAAEGRGEREAPGMGLRFEVMGSGHAEAVRRFVTTERLTTAGC